MEFHKMHPSVVLIFPPTRDLETTFPVGLGYLAAVLRTNKYDVRVFDLASKKLSSLEVVTQIKNIAPEFVGFTVYTCSYNIVKQMINDIKKNNSGTKIIVGGPHASALPKESLEDLKADFVVVGEGEEAILEIIKRVEENSNRFDDIKGIAYWNKGISVLNSGCNLVEDLDKLPFPDWETIPLKEYTEIGWDVFFKSTPIAPILTSRGCPHQCVFCASHVVHGRGFRRRDTQIVGDEMEFLVRKYGIKEFEIIDDTFTEVKQHAMGICKEIIKRGLNVRWSTLTGVRLDTIDEELLQIFQESGCYKLNFGIETSSEDIMKKIKKPITQPKVNDKLKLVKKYKIKTVGHFIFGLPGDTEKSIMDTIRFARSSDLDFPVFMHAIPFPGSEMFSQQYVNLDSVKWDSFYCFSNQPFNLSSVSRVKLRQFLFTGYLFSYLKFKRIKNILIYLCVYKKLRFTRLLEHIVFIMKGLIYSE